ncbi:MAG: formate hydrogenlyase transcriptional activator FlhA [Serratia liquefaciens]|jgi:formate hydrogenlyase transcriptional activator|uniref:formate hydrogenlyase transcriptional activator FlhA n=1 Tax=Serratia liquefaciens TaxID=614 RepID=UPI000D520C7B|nr:formate hydrogenlyase transcriptional activator FlhA [Serratia liquefaciens]MCH4195337.1 formate hydrogenlyase transcriptional activator FlhA [Serratia liquefaciens]MCH4231911.1 formate hydrogenlyase transcriptional activator FlhA [Serratia liquefaciens]MCH4260551.1 formate hydrogenlyase transcriptional activator FlhA [Serratia liquefaciens]MCI1213381.1 formate hydrogenlyase transcriptional activator FlhA [Serratia liquefaciens]MCI1234738.1 formate hydrogenlyase transcriptional activator Fl
MSNTQLEKQELLEITRTLLSQRSFTDLLLQLRQILQRLQLADQVTLVLFDPDSERVSFYGLDAHRQPVSYQDETLLANGPVSRLRQSPLPQRWQSDDLHARYPQIGALALYLPFNQYCLMPLHAGGTLIGGCEVLRCHPTPFADASLVQLQTLMELVALAAEQLQLREEAELRQRQLRHERDDYRILVDVTNAVLSKLDLDDLIGEISKEIHRFFKIDAISIVLCVDKTEQVTIYSTHYLQDDVVERQQYSVALAGTLSEQVMQSGEMLLLNLKHSDRLAAYERQLFDLWHEQIQTLCVLPLVFGNKTLGVLKLAQCQPDNFNAANLRVLQQIAERIAIAVDNALAYQEINRLKESLVHENLYLTEQINGNNPDFGEIVGRSVVMSAVLKQVEMVAKSDCSVLILGETGTGKELIARAIHNLSERRDQRMVKMNCAVMPAGLLESDLFGHEKGAFTGATNQRMGRFELADKGTLFLDEVGEIPVELQPKLLRVLQEREFERVGGNKVISVDVRLIAATNRDLQQMVADREFRSDLFYRLNVFPIVIPPLRERPEDIPQLVKFLTYKIARRMKRTIDSIPAETLRLLSQMPWPGNVRELENVIERAVLLTRGTVLNLQLPELQYPVPSMALPVPKAEPSQPGEDERQQIIRVLKETNGVVAGPRGAAQRLGLKRTTLLSRMKKWGILVK